ncbi:MAG TPA: carboxypeptidase-like regulatory domain-containing protein [Solirubrobacterales bacterium]|nr:carboxypeptidase-like regulatory domain-containing protein [Solirubrobacterales bacterium]
MALGLSLALALLLLAAREANAGKYSVAQCGWYVGADAGWADTTGGAKFRSDGYCVPPPGHDPFDGVHLKSFTRDGSTVSGTRFARWRWDAPSGTAITRVSGTWWHTLHDGMEQRIGVGTWGGGFDAFATAGGTDTTPRNFLAGISPPQPALEDRLLCAKPESSWCNLSPGSWSGIRALTITIEDNHVPAAGVGGALLSGGWKRGVQSFDFWGGETGGGIRYGETTVDGARVNLTEYPCAKAMISSEWRATQMRPCELGVSSGATLGTGSFSDGTHSVRHCVTDFSGNVGCTSDRTLRIDNNPPAHPRSLSLADGDGWRRINDFDLSWVNPDQGPASPIDGAFWRITGPAGFDSGVRFEPGHGIASIGDRTVPAPGTYSLEVWLRDEAHNDARSTAVGVPLRFDNVNPAVAFEAVVDSPDAELPEVVQADISDAHSGPLSGEVHYRRLNADHWTDLPTKLVPGGSPSTAHLLARVPNDLGPGTYVFRAQAADVAGNAASSTRRADGTEMALRKTPPPPSSSTRSAARQEIPKAKTRVFARLRWRRHRGPSVTVPFGGGAALSGRLVDANGAGLSGRTLRVVSRPSRGALAQRALDIVSTGSHGGFRLALPPGPSRRITVNFAGEDGFAASRRPALALRVRGGLLLHASPLSLRTGDSVRLWGRVRTRGAPLPRRGKLVAIQYYEDEARRWRPIMVVRSDHSARFQARYRFRYVTDSARIRLRAVALAEERWPYAPGASHPVAVRVSGESGL